MTGRIIIAAASVITLACLWMVYMAASAADTGGIWLFAAFAFLFGAPVVVFLIQRIRKKDLEQPAPAGVRFVPHWQLLTMIIIALLAVAVAIIASR